MTKKFYKVAVISKDEARQIATDWQHWQAKQNLSYEEMLDWQEYFEGLAEHWDLVDEFSENGII